MGWRVSVFSWIEQRQLESAVLQLNQRCPMALAGGARLDGARKGAGKELILNYALVGVQTSSDAPDWLRAGPERIRERLIGDNRIQPLLNDGLIVTLKPPYGNRAAAPGQFTVQNPR
ncbi:MAG: hypothetical protein R3F11_03490 [Verrucomicrobiales bacterium]